MGSSGNCKYDVTKIICDSDEFYEGCKLVLYYFSKRNNAQERDKLMNDLISFNDYQKIQRIILSSDEYAHFD